MFDSDTGSSCRHQRRVNPNDKQGFTYLMFSAVAAAAIALAGCASESETASEPPASAEKNGRTGTRSGGFGHFWAPSGRAVAYADGPAFERRLQHDDPSRRTDPSAGAPPATAWRGGAEVTGDQMSFGNAISTMMACPEAAMISERRFLSQLPNVQSYKIEKDVLTLSDAAGGLVMRP